MLVGCHVSIRAGYLGAAKNAFGQGARSFQYFPKNPRSLAVKAFDAQDARACKQFCQEHSLLSIAHTPYPTQLSVDDKTMYRVTVDSLLNDLEIAEACGSIGIVVHFGQYKGTRSDPLYGYLQMIGMLNEVLSQWQGSALLLLENNAGQGNRMGTTLEELTQVRDLLDQPQKVGFCLDTCHAFASGLWQGENWGEVAAHARALGYLQHVKAVHLNDSVYPHQSYRDRHANIGTGFIPEQGFADLFQTPEFQEVPFILETPHHPGKNHEQELAEVKQRWQSSQTSSLRE
ncbi:deoxyribonuclease IV [Brevibacillus panacihumi]|uniref:Deoxyribonuclease IV n=1 Tax=Brevibacillus panacihumi TaxID=497735 RepID=A0A3M8DED1_9BACL|nr:deoxyribonuclease IV [Brevibacillus panacihumi]RNB86452.1 deoxyribonuclease IV [Brevibacillus panacihumi]